MQDVIRSLATTKAPEPAFSDYGDDDFDEFDDDTILQLEASMTATQSEMGPRPETAATTTTTISTLPDELDDKLLDEFEDLDEDIFDEAEELITANSQSVPQAPATTKADDLAQRR